MEEAGTFTPVLPRSVQEWVTVHMRRSYLVREKKMDILELGEVGRRTRIDSRTSCCSSLCSVPFRIREQRGRDEDHREWKAEEIGKKNAERLTMKDKIRYHEMGEYQYLL